MEIKYFIGIDFGHGETSVSRVPGYNDQPISHVPLRVSSHDQDKKVISAICQHNDGTWHFVWSKDDLKRPSIREGFKGSIATRSAEDRESLRIFAQLVFKAILENDPDLQYDPQSGEANFVICIACPSDWRRQSENTPAEYLQFFRDECGIKPITMCINESDAAFYTKFDKDSDDTVFVIDLGSSTIDFTTHHKFECIYDCCWGASIGAHQIEELLIEKGEQNKSNIDNLERVRVERNKLGLDNPTEAILLATRFAKETFFANYQDEFDIELRFHHLIPNWPRRSDAAFELYLANDEFEDVIRSFTDLLKKTFIQAAERLEDNNIIPDIILLSGGASRMKFVADEAAKAFPKSRIYKDPCPEWVVSDGAARYISIQSKSIQSMVDEVSNINYEDIYKEADIGASQKATEQLFPAIIADITGDNDYSCIDIGDKLCDFFRHLSSRNNEYCQLFYKESKRLLNSKINEVVRIAILNTFNKTIDLEMTDVNVDLQFLILDWPPSFWGAEGKGFELIAKTIVDVLDSSGFSATRPLTLPERRRIAQNCLDVFLQRDPFHVKYDPESLKKASEIIKEQTITIAKRLYHEKELFKTSQNL